MNTFDIYLEIGTKRTFTGALDWPGWCRNGRDEGVALAALFAAAPRYAAILHQAQIPFDAPTDPSALVVVERLVGNTTTDFGAPDIAPSRDNLPFDAGELERCQRLLQAYWLAFDNAFLAAAGKELRKGPRGGGRDLDGIVAHLLGADASYLARLAWKLEQRKGEEQPAALQRTRQAILSALTAAARGELPTRGPRGGALWQPRYFVRRVAWHLLDHLWEIEERIV